jgi:hypothetical protein
VRLPGKMGVFLDQAPKQAAAFALECLDYRRFEAPDLDPKQLMRFRTGAPSPGY